MAIDWFTFCAQIVNFIILVLLLKRFLYGPILHTMQERQNRIDARWQEAEQQKVEAQRQAEHYRQQQKILERQQKTLLSEAKAAAEEVRQDLVKQVHLDVDRLQAEWQQTLERDRDEFLVTLKERIAREAWEIARRALQDTANVDIEQRVVEVFLERLAMLDEREQTLLQDSVREPGRHLAIRSSFQLSSKTRQSLLDALQAHQMLGDSGVQFSIAPELIAGVELQVGDRVIAWSLESYLESLEDRFSTSLAARREALDMG
ncbi:MAG: F0F1 ATP synthase subunit delta [Synechococcus sp.]